MVWNEYPYTNFHDLNMDWILAQMKTITADIQTLNDWKAERETRDEWLDESITDLNTKYAELIELYNTFVDDVNERFKTLSTDLTKQVDDLEERVTEQVNDLESRIEHQVSDLETELRAQFTAFQNDVNAILTVYNTRITNAEAQIRTVEQMIPNMMNMVDPYTGEINTITNIIYEIVNTSKPNALTASEYDGFAYTAAAYDALTLSAYEYDFNGALHIT